MRISARWSISAIALLSVAACGRSRRLESFDNAIDARALPSSTGMRPGEALTYAVLAAGVEVGEVEVAVGEPGQIDGESAFIVATRASLTGVLSMVKYARVDGESTIASADGHPIDYRADIDWGGSRQRMVWTYDGPSAAGVWFRGTRLQGQITLTSSEGNVHGAVSAAGAVRGWNGRPGATVRLDVATDDRMAHATLRWKGNDTLHTARGVEPAARIEGQAVVDGDVPVRFTLWLSDDSDRVPLRMKVYSSLLTATFELTSYEPGRPS